MPEKRGRTKAWVILLFGGMFCLVMWAVDPTFRSGKPFDMVTGTCVVVGGLGMIVFSLISLITGKR